MSQHKIEKGYKCFLHSDLDLSGILNNKLSVITGVNGCGKTTLLHYIYHEQRKQNLQSAFFKTTTQSDVFSKTKSRYTRGLTQDIDVSVTAIIDAIYKDFGLFCRKSNLLVTDKFEVFHMLFNKNSTLYSYGEYFIQTVYDTIIRMIDGDGADGDFIKEKLGIPTDMQIEKMLNTAIKTTLKCEGQKKRIRDNDVKQYIVNYPQETALQKEKICLSEFKKCRDTSKIRSRYDLEEFLYELINPITSIEAIVDKISKKINDDFRTNQSKTRTRKYWEVFNDELKKYGDSKFRFLLNPPSKHTEYEISFHYKNNKPGDDNISFKSLSSGEKIIFELICYYCALKKDGDKNISLIILDEFDANLNPALAELYLDTVYKEFIDNDIRVILTTHSPSTVAEVRPGDLYELVLDNGRHKINHAKDQQGKKLILEKLAPKFVWDDELGLLGLAKCPQKKIVFTEGKSDDKKLTEYTNKFHKDEYKFIPCSGAENMECVLKAFSVIPYFQRLLQSKIIVFLFDFDNKGIACFNNLVKSEMGRSGGIAHDNSSNKKPIHSTIEVKSEGKGKLVNALHIMTLIPPSSHSWSWTSDAYEIEHLMVDADFKRQFDFIESIQNNITSISPLKPFGNIK